MGRPTSDPRRPNKVILILLLLFTIVAIGLPIAIAAGVFR